MRSIEIREHVKRQEAEINKMVESVRALQNDVTKFTSLVTQAIEEGKEYDINRLLTLFIKSSDALEANTEYLGAVAKMSVTLADLVVAQENIIKGARQ
jgi:molecular chaperone GrpE (heat shock protein)